MAKDWASHFTKPEQILFLAYRTGNRNVTVVEITGLNVTDKQSILVEKYSEQ